MSRGWRRCPPAHIVEAAGRRPAGGDEHGSELLARGSSSSARPPGLAGDQRPPPEPATLDERRAWHRRLYEAGLRGDGLARRVRRPGASPLQQAIVADEMARADAPAPINPLGLADRGTDHHRPRHARRRSSATSKKILTRRGALVPALLGARRGLRPGQPAHARGQDRGDHFVVNGQKIWTSGGAHRRLRPPARPDGHRPPEAQGHLLLPLSTAPARRRGTAAPPDHGQRPTSPRSS